MSATSTPPSALAPLQPGLDYHSFANIEQFKLLRAELELRVDFRNKVLSGAVGLEVKRLDPRATDLVLDTRDLDVRDVSEKATSVLGATAKQQTTWVSRPFHFEKSDPILGSPLVIELAPATQRGSEVIKIEYVTSPTAAALAWLAPGDSGMKHAPLFFTLSGPIGARSWIPLQDTPQVRFRLSAHIHTDPDQIAVMSAKNDPKVKRTGDYTFDTIDAIPAHLLALAVGDLKYRELSARAGVYAGKPELAAAARELTDLDALIRAGEERFGAYPWERVDLLVLPPLFPDGADAYPRLDYVSATALDGTGSAMPLAARSIARAWAGDSTAAATWRDLWLNEGLREYLAQRMLAAVYGEPRAALGTALALRSFSADLAALSPDDQPLALDLRGRDPAVAAQPVRAAKAFLLFELLESRFGRDRLDAFLRGYFEHFAGKSVSTDDFVGYLDRELLAQSPDLMPRRAVLAWIGSPGVPADAPLPSDDVFQEVTRARAAWLAGTPARKLDTHAWVAPQWCVFLDGMPPHLRTEQLADLDQTFNLTRSAGDEVARAWLLLVIRSGYQPGFPRLEEFLQGTGRLTLVVPLYTALMQTPAGTATAQRVYAKARPHYLVPTIAALDPIVRPHEESSDDE